MLTSQASSPASWKADSISLSPLLPSCRSTHTLGLCGEKKSGNNETTPGAVRQESTGTSANRSASFHTARKQSKPSQTEVEWKATSSTARVEQYPSRGL